MIHINTPKNSIASASRPDVKAVAAELRPRPQAATAPIPEAGACGFDFDAAMRILLCEVAND